MADAAAPAARMSGSERQPRRSRGTQPLHRLRSAGGSSATLLAALVLPCASAAAPVTARLWDELRVADLDPTKISTLSQLERADVGYTGLTQSYIAEKDWLRLEGITNDDNFFSNNFEFTRVDYPFEWLASVKPATPRGVKLRVGRECVCEQLEGVAAYSAADASLWLRLQFTVCSGCESTAARAAVIIPMEQQAASTTSVFRWLCSIADRPVCHEAPTVTTQPCIPYVEIVVESKDLGQGRCQALSGGRSSTTKLESADACRQECEVTYAMAAASHQGEEPAAVVEKLNSGVKTVCTAYAYSAATSMCAIYTGSVDSGKTDASPDWNCSAGARAVLKTLPKDCAATAGSTPSARASEESQTLSFRELFRTPRESGRCFGEAESCKVHFAVPDLEATLLQLQSQCFEDVDYYLMSRGLPVAQADFLSLSKYLKEFGDSDAWNIGGACSLKGVQDAFCPSSATVDRLLVDADLSGTEMLSISSSWVPTAFVAFLGPCLLAVVGSMLALCIKDGLVDDSGRRCLWLCTGSTLTLIGTYWSGQLCSWFVGRLAVKLMAIGTPLPIFGAAELTSDICAPTAAAMATAVAVMYFRGGAEPDGSAAYRPVQQNTARLLSSQ